MKKRKINRDLNKIYSDSARKLRNERESQESLVSRIDYYYEITLMFDVFKPVHFPIYLYFARWSTTKKKDGGLKTCDTIYKTLATHGYCSIETAKNVVSDLVLFGFIKKLTRGNGFSNRRSKYQLLSEEEGNIVRENNKDLIVNRRKCNEKNEC